MVYAHKTKSKNTNCSVLIARMQTLSAILTLALNLFFIDGSTGFTCGQRGEISSTVPKFHSRNRHFGTVLCQEAPGSRTPGSEGSSEPSRKIRRVEDSPDNGREVTDASEDDAIVTSTVRIDDGGSNLTDRFKYKVNALMGVFDPADSEQDNERGESNILNAVSHRRSRWCRGMWHVDPDGMSSYQLTLSILQMLNFPLDYSFNVVGKTEGDDALVEQFIADVKLVVLEFSGDDEENVLCQVTPRGKKFTKVTVQAQVGSSRIVSKIYEKLEQLELSVMYF